MNTKKRKKKKGKYQTQSVQPMLLLVGLVLLLAVILFFGDFATELPSETEPTLPTLEVNPYLAEDFEYENGYLHRGIKCDRKIVAHKRNRKNVPRK